MRSKSKLKNSSMSSTNRKREREGPFQREKVANFLDCTKTWPRRKVKESEREAAKMYTEEQDEILFAHPRKSPAEYKVLSRNAFKVFFLQGKSLQQHYLWTAREPEKRESSFCSRLSLFQQQILLTHTCTLFPSDTTNQSNWYIVLKTVKVFLCSHNPSPTHK